MTDIRHLTLEEVQPSQFYISQTKLDGVRQWFNPTDLSRFEPIPIKLLDGVPVMTDGHTRAVAALLAGLTTVPLIPDTDELDWDLYSEDVKECRRRGIRSPYDLLDRIVDSHTYHELWDKWCDELYERIKGKG